MSTPSGWAQEPSDALDAGPSPEARLAALLSPPDAGEGAQGSNEGKEGKDRKGQTRQKIKKEGPERPAEDIELFE